MKFRMSDMASNVLVVEVEDRDEGTVVDRLSDQNHGYAIRGTEYQVVVFVGRIVDLFARAHAGDRIFEGLILLRHQTYLGVATDEFAVFFQAFDELVDGPVRGLRLGWGFEKSSLRRHTWSQGIPNTSSALWPQLAGISMISCLWPGLANNGG